MTHEIERRAVTGVFEMPSEDQQQALTRWKDIGQMLMDIRTAQGMDRMEVARSLATSHNIHSDRIHGLDVRIEAQIRAQLRTNDRLAKLTAIVEANSALQAEVARKLHEIADANRKRQDEAAARLAARWQWLRALKDLALMPDAQLIAVGSVFLAFAAFFLVRLVVQ